DQALIAEGVLVLELAVEHPGDDLHVAVGVGVEPGVWGDDVVVAHEQQPVVRVLGVVVIAEAEAVAGVEPACSGMEVLVAPPHVDARGVRGHLRGSPNGPVADSNSSGLNYYV